MTDATVTDVTPTVTPLPDVSGVTDVVTREGALMTPDRVAGKRPASTTPMRDRPRSPDPGVRAVFAVLSVLILLAGLAGWLIAP